MATLQMRIDDTLRQNLSMYFRCLQVVIHYLFSIETIH